MSTAGDSTAAINQAALEQLDALYGFAMTLTHKQTEAEDLVQETYLRAVKAFAQVTPDSNIKGWLFVIMRNVWLNQQRHTRIGPRFVELEAETSPTQMIDSVAEDPHVVYLRKLERNEVREAIERLPERYREIIVLRDIEGFSYQEIAGMLGCPAGTVMSRLGRAREKLRGYLSRLRTTPVARAI
jgi:RNA polymerase sigma-70 factor, ECF subfamily